MPFPRRILAAGLILVVAGSLAGCVRSPEGEVRSAIDNRADAVATAFGDVLTGEQAPAVALDAVRHSGVAGLTDIRNWSGEDFDGSMLSYPSSALYEARKTDHQVIIEVVLTSSALSGGLASSEVIGYSCVKFTGVTGRPPGVLREVVRCPEDMRERSFDGDGYLEIGP
jgi:hypothetical protein